MTNVYQLGKKNKKQNFKWQIDKIKVLEIENNKDNNNPNVEMCQKTAIVSVLQIN